jgi:hypothetical protein
MESAASRRPDHDSLDKDTPDRRSEAFSERSSTGNHSENQMVSMILPVADSGSGLGF